MTLKINGKARSAYAFIAVCESARNEVNADPDTRRVAVLHWKINSTATRRIMDKHHSQPCAFAHGYKHMSAMRSVAFTTSNINLYETNL